MLTLLVVLGGLALSATVALAWQQRLDPGPTGLLIGGALASVLVAGLVAVLAVERDRAQEEARRAAAAAAAGQHRIEALVRNAADVIVVIDRAGRFAWVSPAAETMFGVRPDVVTGRAVLDVVTSSDARETYRSLTTSVPPGTTVRREARLAHADGSIIHADLVVTNLLDDPDVAGHVVTVHDISHRKAHEAMLAHAARHDPLTGLANRTQLLASLQAAQAQAHGDGGSFAVLYVDLDGFKTVNDRFGHAAGDAVLQAVAARLRESVRDTDTVMRVGGDEFVVVCPGASTPDAEGLATRIGAGIARPYPLDGGIVAVTASVGVAIGDEGTDDVADLLSRADRAMLHSKVESRGEPGPAGTTG